jgi:hypothetical protein
MTSPTGAPKVAAVQAHADDSQSPREVLSSFEGKMKQKVKQFDLRVLGNKRKLEKIRGHLNVFLDECQKSLERQLHEFDIGIDELARRVEVYERKLGVRPDE